MPNEDNESEENQIFVMFFYAILPSGFCDVMFIIVAEATTTQHKVDIARLASKSKNLAIKLLFVCLYISTL